MVGRRDAAIAAGYFAYFGAVGVFQPFFPVHLAALGLSALDIGLVLAVWSALRVVTPLGVAWLADAQTDRRFVLGALALGGVLAAAALVPAASLPAIIAAVAALSVCLNGLMPVYDSHTLLRLGARSDLYGRLRLWGSIGYIASSVGVGFLSARLGAGAIPASLVGFVTLTAVAVLALPPAPRVGERGPNLREFAAALRRRPLVLLLLVCFLHLAGFGGYYGFYSLYLARQGYGPAMIGLFWAAGVVAEIALFIAAPGLVRRFDAVRLLKIALAASVVRWLVVAAFPGVVALMLAAQLLHLAGFALFHAVTVQLGPTLMPPGTAARAQALVSSLGWGAGGMAGSLIAGELWENVGPRAVFAGGAVLALAAWLVASLGLKPAIDAASAVPSRGG